MVTLFAAWHARSLMRRERYADARRVLEGLARRGVRPAATHYQCAVCCFRLDDMPAARLHLHAALRHDAGPRMTAAVLELTNHRMIASHAWFNAWPCFSPAGDLLAFTSARDTRGGVVPTARHRAGLYIYDRGREQETCLADRAHYVLPRFSPDGSCIACLSVRNGSTEASHAGLYLIDVRSGAERELLAPLHRVKHHRFMPDGTTIIYSGWGPHSTSSGIYAVSVETGVVTPLVQGLYETTFPDISPDGRFLVYSSWRRDHNRDGHIDFHDYSCVYLKDLVSGREDVIAPEQFNSMFPRFSPDGGRVVYASIRRDTNRDGTVDLADNAGLYLYDRAGATERCVADDHGSNRFPAFCPDGKRIVCIARRAQREAKLRQKGVYAVDLARGTRTTIMPETYYGCWAPAVDPAGTSVAYVSWRGASGRGLFVARMDRLPSPDQLHCSIDENL